MFVEQVQLYTQKDEAGDKKRGAELRAKTASCVRPVSAREPASSFTCALCVAAAVVVVAWAAARRTAPRRKIVPLNGSARRDHQVKMTAVHRDALGNALNQNWDALSIFLRLSSGPLASPRANACPSHTCASLANDRTRFLSPTAVPVPSGTRKRAAHTHCDAMRNAFLYDHLPSRLRVET